MGKNNLLEEITIPLDGQGKIIEQAGGEERQKQDEIYSLMERRDENLIIESMEGRFTEEYVFEYCIRHTTWIKGKRPTDCNCIDTITGLSIIGIMEATRQYGHLQVPIEKVQRNENETHITYMVQVIDTATGSSRVAVAKQSKKMRLKTGQYVEDDFAEVKALSKAQRNGLKLLIPQAIIKSLIEKHRIANLPEKTIEERIKKGFQQLKIGLDEQKRLRKQYPDPKNLLNYLLNLASQKPVEKEEEEEEVKKVVVDNVNPEVNSIVDIVNELELNSAFVDYLQTFKVNSIKELSESDLQVVFQTLKQFYNAYTSHQKTREKIKQELLLQRS